MKFNKLKNINRILNRIIISNILIFKILIIFKINYLFTSAQSTNTMIRNKLHANHVLKINIIYKLIMNFANSVLKMLFVQEITK